jgi:hypothetical protein
LKKWKKKNLIFLSHFDRFPFDVGELYSSPPVFVRSGENLIDCGKCQQEPPPPLLKNKTKTKTFSFDRFSTSINEKKLKKTILFFSFYKWIPPFHLPIGI